MCVCVRAYISKSWTGAVRGALTSKKEKKIWREELNDFVDLRTKTGCVCVENWIYTYESYRYLGIERNDDDDDDDNVF